MTTTSMTATPGTPLAERPVGYTADRPVADCPVTDCPVTDCSVEDLLRRARQRDRAAWDEIVRRYGGLVRARARGFGLQEADAGDAVQATWLHLAESSDRIQHPDRLGGWLTTTLTRECLRIVRQRARTAQPAEDVAESLADPGADPERDVVDRDTAALVRQSVARLPQRWRVLVQAMFDDEARSYAEIASSTGVPIGSLGPTRARALRRLRELLDESGLGYAS
jgi:RNA polymerase sigma factor (sigma-70 family)